MFILIQGEERLKFRVRRAVEMDLRLASNDYIESIMSSLAYGQLNKILSESARSRSAFERT